MAAVGATALAPTLRAVALQAPPGYVAPGYLPAGFQPAGVFNGRADGFASGPGEVALWFRNGQHELGWNQPLAIYETRTSSDKALVTTERRQPEVVQLRAADGGRVAAHYHDGFWQPGSNGLRWAVGTAHSITFNVRGLRVGIRAGRQVGVSRDELMRVAQSILES